MSPEYYSGLIYVNTIFFKVLSPELGHSARVQGLYPVLGLKFWRTQCLDTTRFCRPVPRHHDLNIKCEHSHCKYHYAPHWSKHTLKTSPDVPEHGFESPWNVQRRFHWLYFGYICWLVLGGDKCVAWIQTRWKLLWIDWKVLRSRDLSLKQSAVRVKCSCVLPVKNTIRKKTMF